jgi:hypothetical protein
MRLLRLLAMALLAVGLPACAAPRELSDLPPAVTFRRMNAIEYYEFRLGVSHDGAETSVRGRNCSTDRFHCYEGVSVLVAPRSCRRTLRLLRSRADWRAGDAAVARFLFRSEDQFYYSSEAADRERSRSEGQGGFVYDIERGVIGVWRSATPLRERPDDAEMAAIVDSTKWLESPRTLFACEPRMSRSP